MLDAGYWILDAGYWILDAGYWMLDAGYQLLATSLSNSNFQNWNKLTLSKTSNK